MAMMDANLIPMYRRHARHHRLLLRRWLTTATVYALLLAFGYPCARYVLADGDSIVSELVLVQKNIDDSNRIIAQLQQKFADADATLNATRLVENQADWSILLALLTGELGPDIVLKACVLKSIEDTPQRANAGRRPIATDSGAADERSIRGFHVDLNGFGKSQQDVSQFVLRLERTGLFDRVTLEESRREGFLESQAIAFRLRCILNSAQGGAP